MQEDFNSNVKIAAGAIVCIEQTKISGDVTIGSKTIVHPTATIIAENGPILIGAYNLIEEYTMIINMNREPMVIGSFNVFDVGSHSESSKIGDYNVLESKSRLGSKCTLSTGCVIGSKCSVETCETLPPNTMVYGSECKRRVMSEKPQFQSYQLEFLTKVLPNYQKIEKANFKATDIPVISHVATSPTE